MTNTMENKGFVAMELDFDQLEMVNGGVFGTTDLLKLIDTVTDYVPVINHGKEYWKELNKIQDSDDEWYKKSAKGLWSTTKCVAKCTLDIVGVGLETLVETAVDVTDDLLKD